jgi:hypothetical protein
MLLWKDDLRLPMWAKLAGKYYVAPLLSQFPDGGNRYGPRNFGLLAIQPPDAGASPQNILFNLVAVTALNSISVCINTAFLIFREMLNSVWGTSLFDALTDCTPRPTLLRIDLSKRQSTPVRYY